MKFGAIDIGTNAARLLVGEVCKEGNHSFVKKISYTRIPLRLGDDVFDKGLISPKKAEQFTKTIHAFKLISEIFDVKQLRACATSAMREAKNGTEVSAQILQETGIDIEVISGEEEARLIFGTFFLLDFDKSSAFLVIDVGGGSTEISVFENGKKVASKSFQIGTIRLLKEKTDKDCWKDLTAWLKENVDPKVEHKIFATGGNINKVHKMLGAQQNDPISAKLMKKLRNTLNEMSLEQRVDIYQLKPDRADVIVPACDIYLYILKELKINTFFVPKIGLSDGMVYDMHLQHEITN
jgi:exopolyphosphatase/guanosine-5'-triphosphate,3'-diphosphate pyrophosphatase